MTTKPLTLGDFLFDDEFRAGAFHSLAASCEQTGAFAQSVKDDPSDVLAFEAMLIAKAVLDADFAKCVAVYQSFQRQPPSNPHPKK